MNNGDEISKQRLKFFLSLHCFLKFEFGHPLRSFEGGGRRIIITSDIPPPLKNQAFYEAFIFSISIQRYILQSSFQLLYILIVLCIALKITIFS